MHAFSKVLVPAALVMVAVALPVTASADQGAGDGGTQVRANPSLAPIAGAFASIDRSDESVTFEVTDTGLAPNTLYAELWAVFNHPENCTHPTIASRCDPGSSDANPATTGFSVISGPTFTTDAGGRAVFTSELAVGQPARVGPGLTAPETAEVALLWGPAHARFEHLVISDPDPEDNQGG